MKTKTIVVKTKIVNVIGHTPKTKTVNTHIDIALVEDTADILILLETEKEEIIKCINDSLILTASIREQLKVITQKEIYL